MIKKKSIIPALAMLVVFILFTVSLKFVDLKPIGPEGSVVGYSSLNGWFFDFIGENVLFDKISDILAVVSIAIGLGYAFAGLYQLVTRKSLMKVDKQLYVLAAFLVLMVLVYVVFEFVVINYRPVLEDGVLEASYPSSHTVLTLCICFYSIVIDRAVYYANKKLAVLDYVSVAVITLTLASRLLSGVHWLTDIIGSVLISITLSMFFSYALYAVNVTDED